MTEEFSIQLTLGPKEPEMWVMLEAQQKV